jgi:hypothetical protein
MSARSGRFERRLPLLLQRASQSRLIRLCSWSRCSFRPLLHLGFSASHAQSPRGSSARFRSCSPNSSINPSTRGAGPPSMTGPLSSETLGPSSGFFGSPLSKKSSVLDSTSWQLPLGAGARGPRTTFYPCRRSRVLCRSYKTESGDPVVATRLEGIPGPRPNVVGAFFVYTLRMDLRRRPRSLESFPRRFHATICLHAPREAAIDPS